MKTILDIQGMHCASCASTITKKLKSVDGVTSANVNYATRTAVVEHAQGVDAKALTKAVDETGYSASLRQHRKGGRAHHHEESTRFPSFAVGLALLLALVSMGPMIGIPVPQTPVLGFVQFALALAILFVGRDVFRAGVMGVVRNKSANMDTLIVLGTSAAMLYGAWQLGAWAVSGAYDPHALYFETAGLIMAFILLGRYFEARAKTRTRDVLSSLLTLQPETARLVVDKTERDVPVSEVAEGDVLKIRPGDRIPVDGVIHVGSSRLDESMLTGESVPVKKSKDDEVFTGTVNKTGMFLMRATATGDSTALARIVRLVEDAQSSKAPVQRVADRVAAVFVPAVVVLAALTLVFWLLFPPAGMGVGFALTAMISVLIIACPCALGLATPTAVMVSMGVAGKKGVLFKNAQALQQAASVEMVAFDKTGTLTLGEPRVQFVKTYNDLSEQVVFRYAASVESASNHPLAEAVVAYARENNINFGDPRSFEELEGSGVKGKVEGRKIVVGSLQFFQESGIGIFDVRERVPELSDKQMTPVLVAVEGRLAALIGVADPLKDSARDGVHALAGMGVQSVMLTGDREEVAQVIARELGIDVVRAQLRPEDKLSEIRKLRRKRPLAMVGDGINDAPALAEADVGIAIGSGTDVAVDAGDVVLVGDDVTAVGRALFVARRSMRVIRQNLGWAFGYNVLAIPVAAGVLYPWTGWLLSPVIAGGAMAFSSLSVVLNSLRLKSL